MLLEEATRVGKVRIFLGVPSIPGFSLKKTDCEVLAVCPTSSFPPLLSPRSPHPALTLGSWGVETGAGVEKRGREREDKFLLGLSPPPSLSLVSSGRFRSCGEFS